MATKAKTIQSTLETMEGYSAVYETITLSSTKGINVKKIPAIKQELENYKKNVSNKINIAASSKKIEEAMKGSNSIAKFKQAQKTLNQAIIDLLGFVTKYENALDTVKQNYEKHDTSVNYDFSVHTK